jgi:hypothetical protein
VKLEAVNNLPYQLPCQLHFTTPGCELIEIPVKLKAANNLPYLADLLDAFYPAWLRAD